MPNHSGKLCADLVRFLPGGSLRAENVPLRFLIRAAYRIRDFEITGGPSWVNTDRYDVAAKAQEGAPQDQLPLMLQALLAQRFKMTLRRETKELPVFLLVAARGGIKLSASREGSCVPPGSSMPPPSPNQPEARSCGTIVTGVRGLSANKIDMAQFANGLSGILGRTVIDRTGFTGTFDVSLDFAHDEATAGLTAIRGPGCGPAPSALDPSAPSIFTAVQVQLGLKLESSKGPDDILVIDRVERPSEN